MSQTDVLARLDETCVTPGPTREARRKNHSEKISDFRTWFSNRYP
ncbi:hypothetical protein SAMN02745687_02489, partial [Lachnospiraceae bacterium NK3A20]